MKTRLAQLTLLSMLAASSAASAREFMNSSMLWLCADTGIAHATCVSTWSGWPEPSFLSETDLEFKCELFRDSVRKREDLRDLSAVSASGTQTSQLLETELTGHTANYCAKNRSRISAGFTSRRGSTQDCKLHSTAAIEP
ncbi:MAG: hypothetical protein AAGD86_14480 [Pseudomonadota bacterium]